MHLPLLERRKPELETCAFCPKLSRAVCPVSNADGKETTTPWGKMSAAYLISRGAVEPTAEQAWPPWACTGCFACKRSCELSNDVAGTLLDARADFMSAGLAPEAAKAVVVRHHDRVAESDRALAAVVERARARGARVVEGAPTRVMVGCMSARTSREGDDVAADVLVAASKLLGEIGVVTGCCGSPLRSAGDRDGFVGAAQSMRDRLAGAKHVVVADAGCAHTMLHRYPEVSVTLTPHVRHFVELVEEHLPRLSRMQLDGPVRYHDACHLGRGLGLYEPPRAVLAAILGRAPDEFARRRDGATCAGGGGLVPVTAPDTARTIAETRVGQHREEGGGAIVTTCASSRKMFAKAGAEVHDLATLVARALESGETGAR